MNSANDHTSQHSPSLHATSPNAKRPSRSGGGAPGAPAGLYLLPSPGSPPEGAETPAPSATTGETRTWIPAQLARRLKLQSAQGSYHHPTSLAARVPLPRLVAVGAPDASARRSRSGIMKRMTALSGIEAQQLRQQSQGIMPKSLRAKRAVPVPPEKVPPAQAPTLPRGFVPPSPSGDSAPPYVEHVVIDARQRFEARNRPPKGPPQMSGVSSSEVGVDAAVQTAPIMAAVLSHGVDFGPPSALSTGPIAVAEGARSDGIRSEGARIAPLMLREPISLLGEALGLWYQVPTSALASHIDQKPFSFAGKSLFGICVGRFELAEQRGDPKDPLHPPGLVSVSPGDALLELTLLALIRGPDGFAFRQVGRLVDAGAKHDLLKALAHKRPRELAYMNLSHTGTLWTMQAQGRSGVEEMGLEVAEQSWLNGLGMGAVVGSMLTLLQTRVPLGGELARFVPNAGSRIRMGKLVKIHLPERIHLGMVPPHQLLKPDAVTILPRMVVQVNPIRLG